MFKLFRSICRRGGKYVLPGIFPTGTNPNGTNPGGIISDGANPTGIIPTGIIPTGIIPAGIISAVLILAGLSLSGCAAGKPDAGSGARLEESGDHICMHASADTSAETLQSDAQIIEERLISYAGEGNYSLQVTLPGAAQENTRGAAQEDAKGAPQEDAQEASQENTDPAGRIDIYLEPSLKGKEDLGYLARVFVSGNGRFSLYSIRNGFLNEREGTYLDLKPEDLVSVELTRDYPEEMRVSQWDEPVTGIELRLSDAFMAANAGILEGWDQGIGLIMDIKDRTYDEMDDYIAIDNIMMKASEDPGTFYIVNERITERETANIAKGLQKEPLAGSYEVSALPAVDWDRSGVDPDAHAFLCTKQELQALQKETVTFTLPQYDTEMDDAVRAELLEALCVRLDALGMPYCIGEVRGQKWTIAVETLPDHINEQVLTILRNVSPLNLAAVVYMLPLEGGLYNAEVVTLENGDLALDLSLTSGRKDTLLKMTEDMSSLGGGDMAIYLQRTMAICGAFTDREITDGHIVLEKNFTGIGGSTWNAGNRWILDLVCAVIDNPPYPSQKRTDFMAKYYNDLLFRRGEYAATDSSGILCAPSRNDFNDDVIEQEVLGKLRETVPDAWFGEKSEREAKYCVYNIHLGMPSSEDELSDTVVGYLSAVYQLILTGPVLNVNVYPAEDSADYYSMYTFFKDEKIDVAMNNLMTEETFAADASRSYRSDPGQLFRLGALTGIMGSLTELMR